MNSVLIIGQNGQLSTYLQRALTGDYRVQVASRGQLDLSRVDKVKTSLQTLQPDLIINPAAYTAVDMAEQESAQAFTINRDAVKEIAEYSQQNQIPLIHFSTDYVFDGDNSEPYTELHEPSPSGVYGQSKLAGEQAVTQANAPAIVLRTSWVYSNHGKNFYKTMLSLAETRDELSVVADQIGAPTYAGSIAHACRELVATILSQGQIKPAQIGIYHLTCQGQTCWSDFAREIFTGNGMNDIVVNPITTAEYPTPAQRPAFSVLNNDKLKAVFGLALPTWNDALADCIAETKRIHTKNASTEKVITDSSASP